jgi:type I restriction enzyme M protein
MLRHNSTNGAELGFEQTLWAAADKLRGHLDAAEYKGVVLGLIFLKFISDAFYELYDQLRNTDWADPRIATSTLAKGSFGCRRRRAGISSSATPSGPRSAS